MEAVHQKINFDGAKDTFELISALTVTQGQAHVVKKKDVIISKLADPQFAITDIRQAVIPLSNLQVGTRVTIRYKLHKQPPVTGFFTDSLVISNQILAAEEKYVFESEVPLKKLTHGLEGGYELKESQANGKFHLELTPNSAAYATEGKKLLVGSLALTSGSSWVDLNKSISLPYEVEVRKTLPPSFKKIVEQAKALPTPKEQIEVIARELAQKITYAGHWNTKDGQYLPRGHHTVVKSGKGDCKDFSTSMAAILRSLGYQSFPALTTRQSVMTQVIVERFREFPSPLVFNHAIVWFKDKTGKTWWVDPTNPIVIADVISDDILGSPVLVLDGKSSAESLPKGNQEKGLITISQKVSFEGESGIVSTGQIEMNPVAYNSVGMAEKQLGQEFIKKFVLQLISGKSKSEVTATKRTQDKNVVYDFKIKSDKWRISKGSDLKAVSVSTPLAPVISLRGLSFGPLIELRSTTQLSGVSLYDPLGHDCFLRSPWVDHDRRVTASDKDVTITDWVEVKKSYLSKEDITSPSFKSLFTAAATCIPKDDLVISVDKYYWKPEVFESQKIAGPPLETMNDEDAIKLAFLTPSSQYALVKRVRYFENQLKNRPKDPLAYLGYAATLRHYGHYFQGGANDTYFLEALKAVEKGLSHSPENYHPELISERSALKQALGKRQEANADLHLLLKKSPQSFATYMAGARLNDADKKYDDAITWLQRGKTLAKTPIELLKFNYSMRQILESQKKIAESHPYLEYVVAQGPVPSANLQRWAREYADLKQWDKALSFYQKALESIDDARTREAIAWVYCAKVREQLEGSNNRMPASLDDTKKSLDEALRYDPNNSDAHWLMSLYYQEQYKAKQDPQAMAPGRVHIEKAYGANKKDSNTERVYQEYKRILKF